MRIVRLGVILCLGLLVGGAAPSGSLEVKITGIQGTRGKIVAALFDGARFDKDRFPCPLLNGRLAPGVTIATARASAQKVRFESLSPGQYAVAFFHDENGNGRPDVDGDTPKEGGGFSQDPLPATPTFANSMFTIRAGPNKIEIKTFYPPDHRLSYEGMAALRKLSDERAPQGVTAQQCS